MSGDYSRISFDPARDFCGVLLQQGRVHLDSEWNELVSQAVRRFQAGTLDTVGRAIVPRETPDGFKIEATGGKLTIGPGRIYVHGLLAENHGGDPVTWNPVLAEQAGTTAVDYGQQPYLKNPPALPGGGPHLVYLDVWQRELGALQDRGLIEKAVAIDTTLRLQTVWQVRLLANVGATVDCKTPLDQVPGWPHAPSAGRLTTATGGPTTPASPCLVPVSGGYKGLENQLYRIEVHKAGGFGTATFKWSRENASVATRVEAIPALDRLVVESVGRDSNLRFSDGDWVEITDDWRELSGVAGELRRIKAGGGVQDATRTIVLDSPLPAGAFPTDAQGRPDPARNTRLRRWDQKGVVRDSAGALFHDLDAGGSTGAIPIPASTKTLVIENGILATFHLDPPGGEFKVGDYWVLAARSADASIEILDQEPPRGIHHHYTKLALVTFPDAETDCRTLWPPEQEQGCECTVCVTAEGHNSGTSPLQHAIDSAKAAGATICLGPGVYKLTDSLVVDGAESLRIRGKGPATQLVLTTPGTALRIQNSKGVWLESLAVLSPAGPKGGEGSVLIRDSAEVSLRECEISSLGDGGTALGIGGWGLMLDVRRCTLKGGTGVGAIPGEKKYLAASRLTVEDNVIEAEQRGIALEGECVLSAETRLAGNLIEGASAAGILCTGAVLADSVLNVTGNTLHATGSGIVVGGGGARIQGNEIHGTEKKGKGDGIVLAPGLDPAGLSHCQVIGNRITGMPGGGISIRTVAQAVQIKQNVIADTGGSGIVVWEGGQVRDLVIENNQLLNVHGLPEEPFVAGMLLIVVDGLVEVLNNRIWEVGRDTVEARGRVGIGVAPHGARVAGNSIAGVGPAREFLGESFGIVVGNSLSWAEVAGNQVQRRIHPDEQLGAGHFYALQVWSRAPKTWQFGKTTALVPLSKTDVLFSGAKVKELAKQPEVAVTVRGNTLEGDATAEPAADINVVGTCLFADNQCRVAPVAGVEPAVARIVGTGVSATGNRLRNFSDHITLRIEVPEDRFAVVGNLISGPILVNDHPLDPASPWKPLNPHVP